MTPGTKCSKNMEVKSQIWKGFFSYFSEEEDGELIEERISFEMKLKYSNGTFEGTTVDEETKGLFKEPITVKGFAEGKFINFVVQYPHNYYYDEKSNQLKVDYNDDYPGCEYTGEYDEIESKFFGEWKLEVKKRKTGLFQNDFIVKSYTGYWEMKRIE